MVKYIPACNLYISLTSATTSTKSLKPHLLRFMPKTSAPLQHIPCHAHMQTADAWASRESMCIIPGWGYPQYPWTQSMDNVCDQRVVTLDLVNLVSPNQKVRTTPPPCKLVLF